MTKSKEDIKKAIREAVRAVTGIEGLEDTDSLVDRDLGIAPVNFLYIFDILEKDLQIAVCEVLETITYQVMTIESLATAISHIKTESLTVSM